MLGSKYIYLLGVLAVTAGIGLFVTAVSAEVGRGVTGEVVAIKDPIITVKAGDRQMIYTVDAKKAEVILNDKISTVADIEVGDMIMVIGTINGTRVLAERISDAKQPALEKEINAGDGQQIFNGRLTMINGTTMIVADGKTVYTVDASSAVIHKGKETNLKVSDIAIGSRVMVRGVINGQNAVASIVTQLTPEKQEMKAAARAGEFRGFFNKIGDFFKNIFNKKR